MASIMLYTHRKDRKASALHSYILACVSSYFHDSLYCFKWGTHYYSPSYGSYNFVSRHVSCSSSFCIYSLQVSLKALTFQHVLALWVHRSSTHVVDASYFCVPGFSDSHTTWHWRDLGTATKADLALLVVIIQMSRPHLPSSFAGARIPWFLISASTINI